MLTVKWRIERPDGSEVIRIFEANNVAFGCKNNPKAGNTGDKPPERLLIGEREVHQSLFIIDPYGDFGMSFDCGTIYVMNETGSTVAKYVLGNDNVAGNDSFAIMGDHRKSMPGGVKIPA